MGLFGNLFGEKKTHDPLDPGSEAARLISEVKPDLEALAKKVKDPMEVIPVSGGAYVFVGKPPKTFGLAWVIDGKVMNIRSLMEEHNLSSSAVQTFSDKLRDAYTAHKEEERYSASLDGKKLTVTPSPTLAAEVAKIIAEV